MLGGEAGGGATDRAWRFGPRSGRVVAAPPLPRPVAGGAIATIGKVAYLIGGTGPGGEPLSTVIALRLRRAHPVVAGKPPFTDRLMIADRGNNRIIVVNAQKKALWRFPSNVQLAYPSGKLLWSFGHPGVTGSKPGYLHEPDDAYLWKNGDVSVADAENRRILLISPHERVLEDFGGPQDCAHEPPRRLASPNGDTPLANGDIIVSEVNGSYIDEITPRGRLVWSLQLPISYPSDPQQLGPNLYLAVDYANPDGFDLLAPNGTTPTHPFTG